MYTFTNSFDGHSKNGEIIMIYFVSTSDVIGVSCTNCDEDKFNNVVWEPKSKDETYCKQCLLKIIEQMDILENKVINDETCCKI